MIATQNHEVGNTNLSTDVSRTNTLDSEKAIRVKNFSSTLPLFLPSYIVTHHPKAGLNPLVDAAGYLFTILGKLKHLDSYRQLSKLQKELIQEMTNFQENIKNLGYNAEYIIVCRYAIAATFDDVIANTTWGAAGLWNNYSLQTYFNQDSFHQEKFFTILDRAMKEPTLYIDLMELMYICLSMGYKGQYRATEHNQYQLDQIINNLYKHIRAYRGSFSKRLSPEPQKSAAKTNTKVVTRRSVSFLFIGVITACVVMTIFVSLGYLMDVISNESYKNISQIKNTVSDTKGSEGTTQ